MLEICELWIVILWYELNPRVRCAFGNVSIIGYYRTTIVAIIGQISRVDQYVTACMLNNKDEDIVQNVRSHLVKQCWCSTLQKQNISTASLKKYTDASAASPRFSNYVSRFGWLIFYCWLYVLTWILLFVAGLFSIKTRENL